MRAWLRGVDDCRAPTNLLPGQSVSECRALRRAAEQTLLPSARQAEGRREAAGASSPILPVARLWTGRENGKEKGEQWRRPQERGERRSEFSSALLSPFSTHLLYCRRAAMEAAAKTRNGYRPNMRRRIGRGKREEKVERRPQERGERRSEFDWLSSLLSPRSCSIAAERQWRRFLGLATGIKQGGFRRPQPPQCDQGFSVRSPSLPEFIHGIKKRLERLDENGTSYPFRRELCIRKPQLVVTSASVQNQIPQNGRRKHEA